jgi:hypothetical protein
MADIRCRPCLLSRTFFREAGTAGLPWTGVSRGKSKNTCTPRANRDAFHRHAADAASFPGLGARITTKQTHHIARKS